MDNMKKASGINGFVLGVLATVVVAASGVGGAVIDRMFGVDFLDAYLPRAGSLGEKTVNVTNKILTEESVVVDVAEKSSPAVVTVSITAQRRKISPFFIDPFGMFGEPFFRQDEPETIEQDIGTGFVVDQEQGLIVTNKHVVSNTDAKYRVITSDDKEFEVERIYRDPVNDIAILKITGDVPIALELGESSNLKVGQFVIAIGTALGEFRHTVTTGVISGLGRGITAGDGYGGFVEELDNVIQTDAAINPGNSGGPLLNSAGQVIGVNTAVARASENIGFAIPIDVVRESLDNFNKTGQFDRPFLGVRYRMISKETAILNDVPYGAYVVEVVDGSAADDAGIKQGDIITSLNGVKVGDEEGGLAKVINGLRSGQTISVDLYRDGDMLTVEVTLKSADS